MKIKVLDHDRVKDGEKFQYPHLQIYNIFGDTHFANNGNHKIIHMIRDVLGLIDFNTKVIEFNKNAWESDYYLDISCTLWGYGDIESLVSRVEFIIKKMSEIYRFKIEDVEIEYLKEA